MKLKEHAVRTDFPIPPPAPALEPFQTRDPVAVFQGFCQREIQRIRETDPEFDPMRYHEAVEMALSMIPPPATGKEQS